MKLYLIQHGMAVSKETDPERPLSEAGERDVNRMAAALTGHVSPARLVHSGKTRALQTAALMGAAVTPKLTPEMVEGLKPKDDPGVFAAGMASLGASLMVVAHQPFLGRLVAHLVVGDSEVPVVTFQPGGVVALSDEEGTWRIEWMLLPELLMP